MTDMKKAEGTFELSSTSELYGKDAGAQHFRSSYSKRFHGDLDGTSQVEVLRCMVEGAQSAAYVGIERFTGSVHGRSGTFALQHSGTMTRGQLAHSVIVIPDTGAGELRGIRGRMTIAASEGRHAYDFEYTFEE